MIDSLTGARLKLKRARDHLEVLSDELTAFNAGGPYRVAHESNADSREHIFRAKVLKEPPLFLSAIIGDALQNMRSALEHLVWGLAFRDKGSEPPRSTGFPIYRTQSAFFEVSKRTGTYSTRSGMHKIADISDVRVKTAIQELQPYKSRNPTEHPLWLLNELARVDRHQSLPLMGAFTNPITQSWRKKGASGGFGADFSVVRRTEIKLGLAENDAVVGYFLFHEPEMEVNFKATFYVAFRDPGPAKGRHTLGTLTSIRRHIESVVVPKLERFF